MTCSLKDAILTRHLAMKELVNYAAQMQVQIKFVPFFWFLDTNYGINW
ncbi:INSulin related [Caenorhabditis elegans]|uniref:INSulin related n=1 Tax=Caenorhabditis elegans TaxID=6239 RepID=Q7K6X2_CAEEL|nr:INSulin related [Caenorhabditis elegans]CAE46684.3 INSulin related [Caenorhabditis elegans]